RARGIGALRRCPHGAAVARMRQIVLQNECEDEAGSGDPEIDLPSETEPECLSARNASETQRATRHWTPLDQDVLENEAEGDRDHGKVDAAHAHAGIRERRTDQRSRTDAGRDGGNEAEARAPREPGG